MIRQPIVAILAHVDHGKTTLLDSIRRSTIALKEAGAITQVIGASQVPINVIKELCGDFLKNLKTELTIPGLLFIDTPGHESFTSLRERGGSIADLAILVIDVTQGIQPQTRESIEIIRNFKVPFVIVANKIDLIKGWNPSKGFCFSHSFEKQPVSVQEELNNKIYEIMNQISYTGFDVDLYNNIDDYTKKVAIIPVSAKTGEGIAELLMVLAGMAQRYLEKKLKIVVKGPAKGTVLEVKNVKGLGRTLDVIIYDGTLDEGDTIVIGGIKEPIVTKIRALFEPKPLVETRESVSKFNKVKHISAACGVKVAAPGINEVIPGMPLIEVNNNLDEVKKWVQKQVKDTTIDTDDQGVILKADSLGSLEAVVSMLKRKNIPIKKAGIGLITKTDVIEAKNVKDKDKFLGVIFGFNVNVLKDVEKLVDDCGIKIFSQDVIYKILEDYEEWKLKTMSREKEEEMSKLTLPCKIRLLPGHTFRQSKPAVIGVEVLGGTLMKGIKLMTPQGKEVGGLKEIQDQAKSIEKAEMGMKVAASISGAVIGRTIKEGDELFSDMSRNDFKTLVNKFKQYLSPTHLEIMREILKIKQKKDPMWGM